jgi:hypothetical protein
MIPYEIFPRKLISISITEITKTKLEKPIFSSLMGVISEEEKETIGLLTSE